MLRQIDWERRRLESDDAEAVIRLVPRRKVDAKINKQTPACSRVEHTAGHRGRDGLEQGENDEDNNTYVQGKDGIGCRAEEVKR